MTLVHVGRSKRWLTILAFVGLNDSYQAYDAVSAFMTKYRPVHDKTNKANSSIVFISQQKVIL